MSVQEKSILKDLPAYVPARSLESAKRELGDIEIVKLAANENNLGCSPKVREALEKAYDAIARYPDFTNTALLERLGKKHGVKDTELIFGNGSFELINVIAQAYLEPGDESIYADPSFGWYKNVTLMAGAKPVAVPLKDYRFDTDAVLDAITPRTKIIWICNPNNPTGTALGAEELEGFISKVPGNVLVALDEAYVDFWNDSDKPDSPKLIHRFDNVIAMRTFSKIYGLASLRLGYAMASEKIIAALYKVKQPININSAAQAAAAASLDDEDFPALVLENNRRGLEMWYETSRDLGLSYIPSNGNFVMVDTALDSRWVTAEYFKRGFIIRDGNDFGMPGWLRITIGTQKENERAAGILRELEAEAGGT